MVDSKKLKIGYFMDDFYPSINGVNLVMDNCARCFGERCEVVLVVPYIDRNYVDDFPYRVIRVKRVRPDLFEHAWSLPTFDRKMKKQLLDEHFDLIHFHSPFIMGRFAVHFARKIGVPVVGTIHTQFSYELDRLHLKSICKAIPMQWIKHTFNMCDECFTVNTAIKDIFTELGVTNKISIVPNATDLQTTKTPDEDKDFINKKYGLEENDTVLLFVGRISTVKNILFLLDSLKVLRDKGVRFKMLFVGPFEDKRIFFKRVRKLQLEDRIIVCGALFDRNLLRKLYVRADLLLFPSYYDTSSLVQVEAASQYTPTVFIENTPTASNVVDGYNGFVAPCEENAYASKIEEALSNKALLDKVSNTCHKTLYLTWYDVCAQLFERYQNLLA